MASFLDPLIVEEVSDSIFKIVAPFRYQSDIAGLIKVPVNFKTDFASVPRIGWIFAYLGDIAHEAAVIHDWLYFAAITTRETADKVLMEAMGINSIPLVKRWLIYEGVRAGGWEAWKGHRMNGDSAAKFA